MDDMEEIGHTQAFQPLFRQLNQGLGPVTDHIQHPGAKGLEPLLYQRLPRGIGPIVRHLFEQEIARSEVHEAKIMRSKNVSSTAPMISRISPPAQPSCSQASAVSSRAASNACMTPRNAEGEHP